MSIRSAVANVFARLNPTAPNPADLTPANIAAAVAELKHSAPSMERLTQAQEKASTFRTAVAAEQQRRETLVSSISITLAEETLRNRALALVESGETSESQEVRLQREREEYRAVCGHIKILSFSVAIAEQKVEAAKAKVSSDVNAGSLLLERAIVSRIDEALEQLTVAYQLERAYVGALESEGVTRYRYQPSSFAPQTFADSWSMANIWRREMVKAGLLDPEQPLDVEAVRPEGEPEP